MKRVLLTLAATAGTTSHCLAAVGGGGAMRHDNDNVALKLKGRGRHRHRGNNHEAYQQQVTTEPRRYSQNNEADYSHLRALQPAQSSGVGGNKSTLTLPATAEAENEADQSGTTNEASMGNGTPLTLTIATDNDSLAAAAAAESGITGEAMADNDVDTTIADNAMVIGIANGEGATEDEEGADEDKPIMDTRQYSSGGKSGKTSKSKSDKQSSNTGWHGSQDTTIEEEHDDSFHWEDTPSSSDNDSPGDNGSKPSNEHYHLEDTGASEDNWHAGNWVLFDHNSKTGKAGGKSGKKSVSHPMPKPPHTHEPSSMSPPTHKPSSPSQTHTPSTPSTTSHPSPSRPIVPPTQSPTQSPSKLPVIYPPLTWLGVNGCTSKFPCETCHGDCDSNEDCIWPYECYTRSDSTPVPGCTSGGSGDIPGADYCYDPQLEDTDQPTQHPTRRDDTRPPRPTGAPKTPVPSSFEPTSALPYLSWKGVNGCTPTTPCDVCEGDCDNDSDCNSESFTPEDGVTVTALACFKRADGEVNQVPGCAVGGTGDIPGVDYCYDTSLIQPTREPTDTPRPTFPVSTPRPSPTDEGATPVPSFSPAGGSGSRDGYFLRSQALPKLSSGNNNVIARPRAAGDVDVKGNGDDRRTRELQQEAPQGWCASGALSPDYYQLLLEACTPDSLTSNPDGNNNEGTIIARMEQMDQLWYLDMDGYVHSIYDHERCMMVASSAIPVGSVSALDGIEAPVEIGPCTDRTALNQFYYDDRTSTPPNTLKLRGFDTLCVTFLGGEAANKGSPMILAQCDQQDKYGWDFVLEDELDRLTPVPTNAPTQNLPQLRYQGRDACNVETPCNICTADCDTNEDCLGRLECFQRERDDSTQVPGCAVGGAGDIPGADYCYAPDGDGISPAPTPSLPPLNWLGAEGCTPESPCPVCTGDCDEDRDCQSSFRCLRRLVGDTTPIPGCSQGGIGDVPGGDYCYDPDWTPTISTQAPVDKGPAVTRPLPPSPPSNPTQPTPPLPTFLPLNRTPRPSRLPVTRPTQEGSRTLEPTFNERPPRPSGPSDLSRRTPSPTPFDQEFDTRQPQPNRPNRTPEPTDFEGPPRPTRPTPGRPNITPEPTDFERPQRPTGTIPDNRPPTSPARPTLRPARPTPSDRTPEPSSPAPSDKPSPSPVSTADAAVITKSGKSSKGIKSPTRSKSGKGTEVVATERTRTHDNNEISHHVHDVSTRAERLHEEEETSRVRVHASTRWEREHVHDEESS